MACVNYGAAGKAAVPEHSLSPARSTPRSHVCIYRRRGEWSARSDIRSPLSFGLLPNLILRPSQEEGPLAGGGAATSD